MRSFVFNIILGIFIGLPVMALANMKEYTLIIKEHQFEPAQLKIPANVKVKIIVENQDVTPEEFESFQLNREKVITAKGKGLIFIGPLKAGTYKFFGDFHKETAQGEMIVQ